MKTLENGYVTFLFNGEWVECRESLYNHYVKIYGNVTKAEEELYNEINADNAYCAKHGC